MVKYISFLALVLTCFGSCINHGGEPIAITQYKPVLITRESLERSIEFKSPESISSPTKIYYKGRFILISERYKGIHVIDNTNPKAPVNKGYITVPGCVDMAIKDNMLYVDNAVDLTAIDISNISSSQIRVSKRIKQAFQELVPPDGGSIPSKYLAENRPKNTVIIQWVK